MENYNSVPGQDPSQQIPPLQSSEPQQAPQASSQAAPAPRQRAARPASAARSASGSKAPASGNRRPSGRRRRRSKLQVFKETYLPMILLALGIILIIAIIVTLSINSKRRKEEALYSSIAAQQSEEARKLEQEAEAASLILRADKLAAGFDYEGAIALLDSFSGDLYEYDILVEKRSEYQAGKDSLVAWADPSQVVSLSLHHLVAEPARAFSNEGYGTSIKYNFLTVNEFKAMLQNLYDNGYILIRMDDIVAEHTAADGTVTYAPKTLYLPEGKKPLMLTQTHNASKFIFDNNLDYSPDCASGFASRLLVTPAGELTSEYINRRNSVLTGEYDFVPLLESFIAENPDFSYMGARATIAVTGENFVFGYQTNPDIIDYHGELYYKEQVAQAKAVADKLKEMGYEFACYTYGNRRYGQLDVTDIQADIESWKAEVAPILGDVDTLVFALDSDIATPEEAYSGVKFETLMAAGFRYFIGFCSNDTPWMQVNSNYVRQGRLTINGDKLISTPALYADFFDAVAIKDEYR